MLDFRVEGVGERLVPYEDGLAMQMDLHARVSAGECRDRVILLEHESVYTAGKMTRPEERPTDDTKVVEVDRGGKITWHGPGQLVGYPIMKLARPIDVVAYVRSLETVLIDTVAEFGIDGHQVAGRSGVWVTYEGHEAKIGAIGVRVSMGTTRHGFALNCSNSFEPYSKIVACGLADAGVTSMSELAGRVIRPVDVLVSVIQNFGHCEKALAA